MGDGEVKIIDFNFLVDGILNPKVIKSGSNENFQYLLNLKKNCLEYQSFWHCIC